MKEYPYKYVIELILAFPSIGAPINFETEDDANDKIMKAVAIFNQRFDHRKAINLLSTKGRCIKLELLTSFQPDNATKEISVLSNILVQNFHFGKYSNKYGRLFRSKVVSYPDGEEPIIAIKDDQEKMYPMIREEAIEYRPVARPKITDLRKESIIARENKNVFIKMSNEILATDDIDKLENYVQQLQNLVSIANTKKDIMIRSKK